MPSDYLRVVQAISDGESFSPEDLSVGRRSGGPSVLECAVKAGDVAAVKTLLDHGANPSGIASSTGHFLWSPLIMCWVELVRVISEGAPIQAHLKIMQMLLDRGAYPLGLVSVIGQQCYFRVAALDMVPLQFFLDHPDTYKEILSIWMPYIPKYGISFEDIPKLKPEQVNTARHFTDPYRALEAMGQIKAMLLSAYHIYSTDPEDGSSPLGLNKDVSLHIFGMLYQPTVVEGVKKISLFASLQQVQAENKKRKQKKAFKPNTITTQTRSMPRVQEEEASKQTQSQKPVAHKGVKAKKTVKPGPGVILVALQDRLQTLYQNRRIKAFGMLCLLVLTLVVLYCTYQQPTVWLGLTSLVLLTLCGWGMYKLYQHQKLITELSGQVIAARSEALKAEKGLASVAQDKAPTPTVDTQPRGPAVV